MACAEQMYYPELGATGSGFYGVYTEALKKIIEDMKAGRPPVFPVLEPEELCPVCASAARASASSSGDGVHDAKRAKQE